MTDLVAKLFDIRDGEELSFRRDEMNAIVVTVRRRLADARIAYAAGLISREAANFAAFDIVMETIDRVFHKVRNHVQADEPITTSPR